MRFTKLLWTGLAGGLLLTGAAWAAQTAPAADPTKALTAPKPGTADVQFGGEIKSRPELQNVAGIKGWRVNGEEIPLGAVQDRAMALYGASVLQAMVVEKLVMQEAKRQGVTLTEAEVDAKLKELREQFGISGEEAFRRFLDQQNVTPQAFRESARLYAYIDRILSSRVYVSDDKVEANYNRFRDTLYKQPATVSFQAVEFPTEAAAQAAVAALKQGKTFQDIAPEAQKASAAQFMVYQKGQTRAYTKDLENAIFTAPLNQVVGPIKETPSGYAVIRVASKTDEHQFTLNEVRDRIRADLRRDILGQQVYPSWLNDQLTMADIVPVK